MNLSPCSFWTPDDLPVSSWSAHAPFMFWLCDRVRPSTVVDLAGQGSAAFSVLCLAIQRLGLPSSAYAIGRGIDVAQLDRYPAFATRMACPSDEALPQFDDGSVDLIHIGEGGGEHARRDYEDWSPKLADDAVVLIHGTRRHGRDFGAWRFFRSLAAEHPSFEFAHGDGLGVICRGPKVPDGLRSLLDADAAAAVATRTAYAVLGEAAMRRRAPAPTSDASPSTRVGEDALANPLARARFAELLVREGRALARIRELDQALDLARGVLAGRRVALDRARGRAARADALERVADDLRRLIGARARAAARRSERDARRIERLTAVLSAVRPHSSDLAQQRDGADDIAAVLGAGEDERDDTAEELGLSPDEADPADLRAARAVLDTGLFDAAHYLAAYPEVAADGRPPALHYAVDGWKQGKNPSPHFDARHYRTTDPTAALGDVDPLLHYAEIGAAAGLSPLPGLGAAPRRLDPLERLIAEVEETGLFDDGFYRRRNPDVAASDLPPILHYALHGWREGRRPRANFDPRFYLDRAPELATLDLDPLQHFAESGLLEGRLPTRPHPQSGGTDEDYARWVASHDTLDDGDRRAIRARLARLRDRPLISVVMTVYDPPLRFLLEAVASVRAQLYPRWELCIADDASTDPAVAALLVELAAAEPRIKLVLRPENGHISAASDSALAVATGEFVALMDHDDLLSEHALYTVAATLDGRRDLDILYSDEDHIDADGRRHTPYFKTDYNPELMLGHNMVNHLAVYRRSLLERIGGFRIGYEGSQDYDVALRAVDASAPERVHHIPHILYHWRSQPGAATFSQVHTDRCTAAARAAIADHLVRTGRGGTVVPHPVEPNWHRVVRPRPDPAPLVSIVVPTKDRLGVLKPCCEGILNRTAYPNVELLVVDHESIEPETWAYLAELSSDRRVRVLPHVGPFNYSTINNTAVRSARGSVLAFLNNDVEVIASDWLDEMVSLAVLPDVGAVGAKLLYADRTVQHAGVLIGSGGVARHMFRSQDSVASGYMGRAILTSACSAVTGAVLVLRRDTFERVGGFDEHLAVAFNDIDLCLKVREIGLRNVLATHAVLIHHESVSRGHDDTPEKAARFGREVVRMTDKWGTDLSFDPYYNPNLNVDAADFTFAPPRHAKPWRL